ncbi:MAG: hypothetical protein RBR82_09885 [Pseudomonas sp.]|nr:hypothetical protein [Pseudomonas sp.]
MSHYVDAKRMLAHPKIGPFLLSSLQAVFKDGYSLQKPNHPDDAPAVEVLVNDMTSEKALLLKVAMGIMEIDYFRPCGVTFQVNTQFNARLIAFKKLLVDVSGLEPESDTNALVYL